MRCVILIIIWILISFHALAICPKPPKEKPFNIIEGKIVEIDEMRRTKTPFKAVQVRIKGVDRITSADQNGYFALDRVYEYHYII